MEERGGPAGMEQCTVHSVVGKCSCVRGPHVTLVVPSMQDLPLAYRFGYYVNNLETLVSSKSDSNVLLVRLATPPPAVPNLDDSSLPPRCTSCVRVLSPRTVGIIC